uniref:Uncharacterized protein n=1 Tax=Tanacetum cinerariifolium TaxID=118510 RepID=A0A699Q187_TANCI|nr:hypothetical protein [Tanacetum cinerariifolium]
MGINNNPSKSKMSPRSISWGRERGNLMKDLCLSSQSANVITMARVLRSATSATRQGTFPTTVVALATLMLQMLRGTVRRLPKEMDVSNAELQDILREIARS